MSTGVIDRVQEQLAVLGLDSVALRGQSDLFEIDRFDYWSNPGGDVMGCGCTMTTRSDVLSDQAV